jgi:hypothetical protein
VLFTNSSASSSLQVAAEDAWEHLAEDENKATILAKVSLGHAILGVWQLIYAEVLPHCSAAEGFNSTVL